MIAPARTGSEKTRRKAVTTRDQMNRGIRSDRTALCRIFFTVVRKFSDPRMDEAPARCSEKMARSTAGPLWNVAADSGG